ncbi:MAG: thioredoxin domain-containing protein [Candidatus Acidiferrales bacterium]
MDKNTKWLAVGLVLAVAVAMFALGRYAAPPSAPSADTAPEKSTPPRAAESVPAASGAQPEAATVAASRVQQEKEAEKPATKKKTSSKPTEPEAPKPDPESGECTAGLASAPVKLEVFSDYQCPSCQRFYLETVRSVIADYAMTGKVCVVYREFPLRQHQYSRPAARYAHASRRLGMEKWVRVSDALFTYQAQWSADGSVESVVAAALSSEEMSKVKAWAEDPNVEDAINRDVDLGKSQERKVTGTPTSFVIFRGRSERLPVGPIQYPFLRRYLDDLLTRTP